MFMNLLLIGGNGTEKYNVYEEQEMMQIYLSKKDSKMLKQGMKHFLRQLKSTEGGWETMSQPADGKSVESDALLNILSNSDCL